MLLIHGLQDEVVPCSAAEEINAAYPAEVDVSLTTPDGGHTIPESVFSIISKPLNTRLKWARANPLRLIAKGLLQTKAIRTLPFPPNHRGQLQAFDITLRRPCQRWSAGTGRENDFPRRIGR